VREETRNGTVWLTLDAPERLNAFTADEYRRPGTPEPSAFAEPTSGVVTVLTTLQI